MIRLGFSPCPNDTFIFYALANGKIDRRGLDFEPVIEDVETLNRHALETALEVTKVSCHAYLYVREAYQFLAAGGALGRGCGPLLVARDPGVFFKRPIEQLRIAVPGWYTTAFLLLRLYCDSTFPGFPGSRVNAVALPFHEIMAAVRDGAVEAGVIIHESRFTYHDYGLAQVVDLGEWWERETGLPIPLGGVIALRRLGERTLNSVEALVRESIRYASAHREETLPYIRRHARELSDEVLMKHIALYVNDYSLDSGDEGRAALAELLRRAERLPLPAHR